MLSERGPGLSKPRFKLFARTRCTFVRQGGHCHLTKTDQWVDSLLFPHKVNPKFHCFRYRKWESVMRAMWKPPKVWQNKSRQVNFQYLIANTKYCLDETMYLQMLWKGFKTAFRMNAYLLDVKVYVHSNVNNLFFKSWGEKKKKKTLSWYYAGCQRSRRVD